MPSLPPASFHLDFSFSVTKREQGFSRILGLFSFYSPYSPLSLFIFTPMAHHLHPFRPRHCWCCSPASPCCSPSPRPLNTYTTPPICNLFPSKSFHLSFLVFIYPFPFPLLPVLFPPSAGLGIAWAWAWKAARVGVPPRQELRRWISLFSLSPFLFFSLSFVFSFFSFWKLVSDIDRYAPHMHAHHEPTIPHPSPHLEIRIHTPFSNPSITHLSSPHPTYNHNQSASHSHTTISPYAVPPIFSFCPSVSVSLRRYLWHCILFFSSRQIWRVPAWGRAM